MDTLLRSLIYEWDYKNKLRDETFLEMPDYGDTERALTHATEALEKVLNPEAQRLSDRYQDARTASAALESTASLICGARICLRLLVTLL